ncbi:MAG: hypothetical protein FJ108_02175 [Deltaproteobacteria bacterium]|nr:hypothetical protein [Deltaproteobacteria bacterium]
MSIRRLASIALSGLFLLALGTWLAGERTEVAELRTFDAAGLPHDTKLWIVDKDGRPWVRIARPGRSWGEQLRANPEAELTRGGVTTLCRAVFVTDEAERRAIDRAFAAKYGWVDGWYGLVLRRDAVPVRLDPR